MGLRSEVCPFGGILLLETVALNFHLQPQKINVGKTDY